MKYNIFKAARIKIVATGRVTVGNSNIRKSCELSGFNKVGLMNLNDKYVEYD